MISHDGYWYDSVGARALRMGHCDLSLGYKSCLEKKVMQLFVLQYFSCCTVFSIHNLFCQKLCCSVDLSLGSMSEIFPLLHFAHMLYFISNAGKNRLIRHCKFNVCVNGVCIWWWDGDLCPGCIQEQVAFNRRWMHACETYTNQFVHLHPSLFGVYLFSVFHQLPNYSQTQSLWVYVHRVLPSLMCMELTWHFGWCHSKLCACVYTWEKKHKNE